MGARRPNSVLVLAILGMVLGLLGTCCCGIRGVGNLLYAINPNSALAMSVAEDMPSDRAGVWLMAISDVMSVLIAAALLAGSIGSLMMRDWARRVMITTSWLMIVNIVFGSTVQLVYMIPQAMEQARANASTPQMATTAMVMAVGIIVMFVVALLAYPVAVLIVYRSRVVADAFAMSEAMHLAPESNQWMPPQGSGPYGWSGGHGSDPYAAPPQPQQPLPYYGAPPVPPPPDQQVPPPPEEPPKPQGPAPPPGWRG